MSLIYSMRLLPNKYGNAPIYWPVVKLLDERGGLHMVFVRIKLENNY